MPTSPTIAALAAALVKAQSALAGAKKDSTNPHFKTAYADLASVWDACRAPLANAGLSVVQLVSSDAAQGIPHCGHAIIETILAHSSGEWVSSTLAVPLTKADAQGLGSAITYGRRYALAAIVGVCPADDDGEAAVARSPQFTAVINKRPAQPAPAQRAQEPDDVPMKHAGDKFRKPTTQTAEIDDL
jgi:hypothetical protein